LAPEGRDLILGAAILSIIANPFLFRAAEELGAAMERSALVRHWQHGRAEIAARKEIPDASDQVIIVGTGA
jgi:hypothetical protein